MADAGEIAKLLNQFRDTGMRDLAPDDDITAVITDYFAKRDKSEEEEEDLSSDEDISVPLPPLSTPEPSRIPVAGSSKTRSTDSDPEDYEVFEQLEFGLPSAGQRDPEPGEHLKPACKCKLYEGKPCYLRFDLNKLFEFRLTSIGLSRDILDASILGCIGAGFHESTVIKAHKRKSTERKGSRTDYFHGGHRVCRDVFKYLYDIGQEKLNNLIKHYKEEGHGPRMHKNVKRRPSHALGFERTALVHDFILNYASVHAIHLPGRTPQHWKCDVKLLPTNCTKRSVFDDYVASCTTSGRMPVALTTFRQLWRTLLPFVAVMKPATDLCWMCQQGASKIKRCSEKGNNDDEKAAAISEYSEHLAKARQERSVYTAACESSKRTLSVDEKLDHHPACSREDTMHYSFDFAQQVQFPSNPLQPGPIFFKSPRKCAVFGICCEALSSQVNFLLDECCDVGKGANCVVSLLHFFFENYGLGEQQVHLHADNCSGQNKNSCMMMYLLWRVLTGRHKSITISFMLTGHTKFSCDWCFGLFKRAFRKTKVDCLSDIADVVSQSAKGNIPQLCGNEKGDVFVPFYDWTTFLKQFFRKVKQIKKYHHFSFSHNSGEVTLKEYSDSVGEKQQLLVREPSMDEFPAIIMPKGLDAKRQWYLYEEIRPFVDLEKQDLVAPLPLVPKPGRMVAADSDIEEEVTDPQPSTSKKAKRGGHGKSKSKK